MTSLAMRQPTIRILLILVAFASAITIAASLPPPGHPLRRSRFLAENGPGNGQGNGSRNGNGNGNRLKCSVDPSICNGKKACCGDSCVDLETNALNCGKCGKRCKFTDSCCGGKCVDLNFDPRHCGSCGNRCIKGTKCYYGMCNYA